MGYSLHELRWDFSSGDVVFKYGYNKVYKAWLDDGSPVAVIGHRSNGRRDPLTVGYKKLVEINYFTAHQNVLHMLGFCITRTEWLLIYPLMVNGSVASYLRDKSQAAPLSWAMKKGIALGAARGLAYLHYECVKKIIHCDITATNILLDDNLEAVVAYFESAKIMDRKDAHATRMFSEKNDVYGYGFFLVELITEQSPSDLSQLAYDGGIWLLDWVKRKHMERKWKMTVDADCGGDYIEEVVKQLTQLALLCTQSTPEGRPKMSEAVRMLEDGDGLGERWEEWYLNHRNQIFRRNMQTRTIQTGK